MFCEKWILFGTSTGTALDCRPKYVTGSPAFGRIETTVKPSGKRGGRVVPQQDFLLQRVKTYIKMSFLDIVYKVLKDLKDVSARIGIFLKSARQI